MKKLPKIEKIDIVQKISFIVKIRILAASLIFLFFGLVRLMGWMDFPFLLFAASPLFVIIMNQPLIWLIRKVGLPRQVFFFSQIFDVIAVTWAVHFLGGVDILPATLAYPIVFIFSALMLGALETYLIANFCFLAYAGMVYLDYQDLIPHVGLPDVVLPARIWGVSLGATFVLFNLIAFVASYLARKMRKSEDDLAERVKELDCFFELARLTETYPNSLDEVMEGMVQELPLAWQYPEITYSRIILQGKMYKTDNYAETAWRQSADLKVAGRKVGAVDVGYLKRMPKMDEGPFLKEERRLLEGVARRLGKITERVMSQKFLEEYSLKLEKSNESLSDFTHIVSHDLQEPLRNIEAFTGFLIKGQMDKLDQEGQGYLRRVQMNAAKMRDLIDNLLALSRVDGKRKVEWVNASRLFKEAVERCEFGINYRQADVSYPEDLPDVYCDPSGIVMVIHNLLCNAMKFIGAGKPRVEMGCAEKGDVFEFFVKDNGRGIKKEDFYRIFDMFVRIEDQEDTRGSGIGLAIVKKIVKAHGGQVRLESKVGEGSTFYFTLPKKKPAL